jgi:hypothetical protein
MMTNYDKKDLVYLDETGIGKLVKMIYEHSHGQKKEQ